jgi:hypothetical protein
MKSFYMENLISVLQITNIKDNVRIVLEEICNECRDRTGSGLCPNMGFDIRDVQPLGSTSYEILVSIIEGIVTAL